MAQVHAKGLSLSVEVNRWILKSIGVWPASAKVTLFQKCFHTFIFGVCYGFLCFLFVPCYLFMIYEEKEIYNRIKVAGHLSICVMAFAKYYELITRRSDIRKCIEYIEIDWRTARPAKDRDIMLMNASFGRRLVLICAFFMYGGVIVYYLILPLSFRQPVAGDENATFIPLVFPVSQLIADVRYSPVNEIFFVGQIMSAYVMHSTTTAACSLAAVFVMHACGQLEVLMVWLDHLVDGREGGADEVNGRLADIVTLHVKVLRFLSLTEKILQQISLVDVVGCTINMCLCGYYILMECDPKDVALFLTYVMLLISLTFNIFIFCYIGELVAEECQKVGEASYMTEWYRLPGKQSLGLILIIIMSNSSIKLTAGNLFVLSMSSFGDVVKTSVGYLNMLRALTT